MRCLSFFFPPSPECSGVKWKGRMVVYSLLSPWLWGAPKTVVHLGFNQQHACILSLAFIHLYYFFLFILVYGATTLIWFELQPPGRLVKAWCVLGLKWCAECECRQAGFEALQALWSRPFEKDLPVILPACPAFPPSSAHCAAVAWDGLPNASGMGGLGPKSQKTLVSRVRLP